MFDIVNKHKTAVQIVLGLITLPFAFFGVDYYFRGGDTMPEVARVGDVKVTQVEFDEAIREQQDRLRQQLGQNFDPAMLQNPEVRFEESSVMNAPSIPSRVASTTSRVSVGLRRERMVATSRIMASSICRRPAVSSITMLLLDNCAWRTALTVMLRGSEPGGSA